VTATFREGLLERAENDLGDATSGGVAVVAIKTRWRHVLFAFTHVPFGQFEPGLSHGRGTMAGAMFPREMLGAAEMLGGGKYQRWKNRGDQ
jgi:hypothetical protein